MNALVIDKVEYEFPTTIKVGEWYDLARIRENEKALIAKALKIPVEDIVKVPDNTLHLMQQLLMGVLFPHFVQYNREVNDKQLIDLNTLKLGTFIDLEVYFTDIIKNFEVIVQTLYDADDVSDWVLHDVYGCIKYYNNWRTMFYKQYRNLFDLDSVDVLADEDTPVKNGNNARMWLDIVMTLCDGKFLDMDAVLDKSVIEAFNWLAWNKDKKLKEQEAIKQATR